MNWGFLHRYGGTRANYTGPLPEHGESSEDEGGADDEHKVNLDYEVPRNVWEAIPLQVAPGWRADTWPDRPVCFVDGKDVGETVVWLWAPRGYQIPVRLSEIGAVVVEVENGICRRRFEIVERVVSMVATFFPWDEVEEVATMFQRHQLRLLLAEPPKEELWFDLEEMRKAAQNRSNTEMGVLEEAVLTQVNHMPTIVDGRLEPRAGGLGGQLSPVVGVIKTHSRRYLHEQGMCVLYGLAPVERTPLFALPNSKLPVISWYVRLSGARRAPPNWAIIRVEVPMKWFERMKWEERQSYVAQLSQLLCDYRCREESYKRASVSLHPIVRAEELLGSLFTPWNLLAQQFYRLTGL